MAKGSFKLYLRSIYLIRRSFQFLLGFTFLTINIKFLVFSMENLSKEKLLQRSLFQAVTDTFYFDAIYVGLLLLVRRLIESNYFLQIKREYQARHYLRNWGTFLQAKGAQMQIKKKTDYTAELKKHMESRLSSEHLQAAPLLKNAVMNRVVEIPKSVGEEQMPYGLTVWLWSTTLVFRFIEFGLSSRLKEVKGDRNSLKSNEQREPTEEELDALWAQYEANNLYNILWKPRPVQLLQAFWTCMRAHSQYVSFITIYYLQAFHYRSFYTLPLPLLVLYASTKYPRPSNLYWNGLTLVMFAIIVGKVGAPHDFGQEVIIRLGGSSAYLEAFLLVSIIWHKSILRNIGLWDAPMNLQRKCPRVAFVDVFSSIFVIQVASTLIVLGSFSSFAAETLDNDGTSAVDLDSDTIPVMFLVVVFLHLIGMALDRILYVSAAFRSRQVFHAIVYLTLHFWLFHFVPHLTNRRFGHKFLQKLYYFLQSIYLLLSAYQVRTRHSRCSAVSVLCQSFSPLNKQAFLIYSNVPFLEPVRRSIDFFFTKTLLSREEFVLIESIFDLVFRVKCERVNEYKYLTNRRTRTKIKTVVGLFAILAMLIFIAAPLIYYTLENEMTPPNPFKYLQLELSSPVLGLMYQQRVSTFYPITFQMYEKMKNHYATNRAAFTFLNKFKHDDVVVAKLPTTSITRWSPAKSRRDIAKTLRNMTTLRPTIKWVVEREVEGDEDFNDHTTVLYRREINYLADMIEAGGFKMALGFTSLLTKFLYFHRTAPSINIKSLMITKDKDPSVDAVYVWLHQIKDHFAWRIVSSCLTEEYEQHLSKLPYDLGCKTKTLNIFLFSSRPPLFGFVKKFGGLIGMYVGVILSLWTYLAKIWQRNAFDMMFDEMVSPDKILQLCLDIYQCRITQQVELELVLGKKMLNIFTSSTEFEKWTKGVYGVDARASNFSIV
ncbi:piezo-type mechanosensitive ion channel component 1-like [Cloeon dipterum]|uniref:piezo-type mechanosensitive ion channel component 1-like n=1 Tax=Cloeon dipterum TaxID=197152 RepID=UPI0032207CE9